MRYRLEELFDLQMGKTPARANLEYWNGTNKWVSISDLSSYDKYVTDTNECISDLGVSESGIKAVPKNTVIMSFKLSIGKTAITTEEVYTNEAIMAFIDKGICEINTDYLYYLFSGTDWNKGTNKAVLGLTLNKATLSKKEIDIPDLHTQNEVVKKLDALSNVIQLKKHSLDKLDELIKSRFVEVFGDIYSNNHKYPVESLSDSILFLTSGSRGWAKYCVDSGREWFITIKNVKDCRISTDDIQAINAPKNAEAKRTRVNEGDLLISITADLGRTGVITKEIADHGAYINQHLTCIRLDKKRLNPLYVAYFLESESGKPQFEAKNQNGVKAGLNFDSIKTLRVLLPPIQIQNQFADFVTQVEKQKATVHQSIDKLETLKKSLMQEYFG